MRDEVTANRIVASTLREKSCLGYLSLQNFRVVAIVFNIDLSFHGKPLSSTSWRNEWMSWPNWFNLRPLFSYECVVYGFYKTPSTIAHPQRDWDAVQPRRSQKNW